MIVPTPRAVLLAGLGLLPALALASARPDLWTFGLAWPFGVLAWMAADALLVAWPTRVSAEPDLPGGLEVGREARAGFALARVPLGAEAVLQTGGPVRAGEAAREGDTLQIPLLATRRGKGMIEALWLRWRGPFGLVSARKRVRVGKEVRVTPNLSAVREEAIRFFSRQALGETLQRRRGHGSEFDALREWQPGMDRRSVDWKHSARHRTLLAREYRTERNQNVVLAIDSGRLMSEPIAPGRLSRLDEAITAALLTAYVALRRGDQAMIFAYDAAPRVATGLIQGTRAWPALQHAAADIDYAARETNHTYGLSDLSGRLDRRSLVVVLTEFADTTAAELMVERLGRLARDHLVLFVAFGDEALEAMRDAEPGQPEDVSRAVVADTLLRERELVLARLRRLGIEVLEARADRLGPALLARTVAIRERGLL